MSVLIFHKCVICGKIFYHHNKTTYCTKCVPRIAVKDPGHYYRVVDKAIERNRRRALERYHRIRNDPDFIKGRRERDRLRWHRRMTNPVFRECERIRSLQRYRQRKEASNDN